MKITQNPQDQSLKQNVRDIHSGAVVVNGEGNICLVMKDTPELVAYHKVRVVRLDDGGSYTVSDTCQYEVVDAEVTWRRKRT